MTRFEAIIGNTRIFELILEDFFKGWPGSHDVMPAEDPKVRLFKRHENFAEFCKEIRNTEWGARLCLQCDADHAAEAATKGEPISYICHAGLLDIAVPIIVDGKLVATIFCGQSRSWNETEEQEGQRRIRETERKLGFQPGELRTLREKTPQVSEEQVKDVKSKLWEVATYVSTLGSGKVEAEKAKRELAYRFRESEAIQEVMRGLAEIVDDLDKFWRKLDGALTSICNTIGATYGALITCEKPPGLSKPRAIVRSVANLPSEFIGKTYNSCDPVLLEVLQEMRPKTVKFHAHSGKGTLCHDIFLLCGTQERLAEIALVPLKLDSEREGVMIFSLSSASERDLAYSPSVKHEFNLLTQAGAQIATAYQNCQLYRSRRRLAEVQSLWLENVSHQLLSPLNEILGQAENLSRSFRRWQQDKPERIDNTLEILMGLSHWAARLASNFAWVARAEQYIGALNLQVEDNMVGRLIGYAISVQGTAREWHLLRVRVDRDSVMSLNGKVQIDRKFFNQAVLNLLDNAVKYANARTEVLIHASLSGLWARIHITSYGIPIKADEVEKVFEREYRSEAAKAKYAVGTGIGLTIARDIIRLHGGELSVEPSIEASRGWKTTFTITLPIQEQLEEEN